MLGSGALARLAQLFRFVAIPLLGGGRAANALAGFALAGRLLLGLRLAAGPRRLLITRRLALPSSTGRWRTARTALLRLAACLLALLRLRAGLWCRLCLRLRPRLLLARGRLGHALLVAGPVL